MASLLVEILTEELPPKSLRALSEAFRNRLLADLAKAQLARSDDFRVLRRHRGRHHHDVGVCNVTGGVTAHDACAERCKALGCGVRAQIGAAHLVAEIHQHFGNAAHTGAADADEVHGSNLVPHR